MGKNFNIFEVYSTETHLENLRQDEIPRMYKFSVNPTRRVEWGGLITITSCYCGVPS